MVAHLRLVSGNADATEFGSHSSPEHGISQHASSENSTGRQSPPRSLAGNQANITDIDLEQLYPASAELNTTLFQTLTLLSQALQRVDRAIDHHRTNDPILADDQMHHLLVLLDELFCLREISEGFASTINACTNSLRNLHGEFANENGLLAINSCLLALKKKPLISFDDSLELIDRLEQAGFDTDTPGTDELVDWLSNENAN